MGTSTDFRPDQENVAYIGAGVTLKGEISVPDLIVVDGTIEGDITARVVCVGQSGVIRGNISATEADISGWISDHIEIKQLLIVRATGRIEGKVMYGELELEKGAVVTGELSATDDYRAVAKAPTQKEPKIVVEAAAAAVSASSGAAAASSLDRISDAVRSAKGGLKENLFLAADGDGRRNSGRLSLTGRKLNS